MELSPKMQKVTRVLGLISLSTLELVTIAWGTILLPRSQGYCSYPGPWRLSPFCEFFDEFFKVWGGEFRLGFRILFATGIISLVAWGLLRATRYGKIVILSLLLGWGAFVYLRDVFQSMTFLHAENALAVLSFSAILYNGWGVLLKQWKKTFATAVIISLVIVAAPLPTRCDGIARLGGGVGGFGADIVIPPLCYSLLSHMYWNHPEWKTKVNEHSLFRLLTSGQEHTTVFD